MTLQEIFNNAWERAKTPVRTVTEDGFHCLYRPEGRPTAQSEGCFIGVSISNEDYSPLMEANSPKTSQLVAAALGTTTNSEMAWQLGDLQTIHDDRPIESWRDELIAFAQFHGLTVPGVDITPLTDLVESISETKEL